MHQLFAKINRSTQHNIALRVVAICIAAVLSIPLALPLAALDLNTYAEHSKLASGKWVKIAVEQSGLYLITPTQARQWGFSDINKVKIYGYGGNRIADVLDANSYIDDLPLVQSETTQQGIVFYGVGPEKWVESSGVYYADRNIYTTVGYYFVTEEDGDSRQIPSQGLPQASNAATTFIDRVHYELDAYSLGEVGYVLLGENFKTQSTRKFTFSTPDATTNGKGSMMATFGVNIASPTKVEFSLNGKKLEAVTSDNITATQQSNYVHGSYGVTTHELNITDAKTEITVSVPKASAAQAFMLDFITLNYERNLTLNADGYLEFWLSSGAKLDMGSSSNVRIWDVTNPLNITVINYGSDGVWTNDYHGIRSYAAWREGAAIPSPTFVEKVDNQDLHALESADMIIFALPEFVSYAQRIAQLHSQTLRPIKAVVVNVNQVYNEFASGAADVSALRKCLKMMYDRTQAAPDSVAKLGYALLLGRATYDNRHLTTYLASTNAHGTIPCWIGGERRRQFSDNDAYGTDDFIAMLDDGSGSNMGLDKLRIGVGRMPWRTTLEAREGVDKLEQYMNSSKRGTWKNSFLFVADDGDKGVHLNQTEAMIKELESTPLGNSFVSKVYVDAYDIIAGSCEGGRNDMYRMLNDGIGWWNYCGHANNHSWTAENLFNYNDINNLYLNRLPVLMAATCDFLRWDSSTLSGGEILWGERYGGVIAMISATRPVYITNNGYFTRAVGRSINLRDSQGMRLRLGDIYRNAKNDIRYDNSEVRSDMNRLRFVLMGDPALEISMPHYIVSLDKIGGVAVDPETQVTIMALQRTTIEGSVISPNGELMADFEGTVEVDIYDAERSITTQGIRDDNEKITFEHHGDKLFAGSAPVSGGKFVLNVAMPGEIADNFREATINMYAISSDSRCEAAGINKDFFVYGFDETAEADNQAPTIETLVLNHESFKSGDMVNPEPMVIARVSDDVGINLSTAGIGHQMTITLDKTRTFTDVALYYSPSSDGTPSGIICYPMPELTLGEHSMDFKIWDTSGNSASHSIDFFVGEDIAPTIYDIYADCNPASTHTNFYITHDRPDGLVKVTITVSNLLGRTIWQSTVSGRSDFDISAPVNWDLSDASGRRVPRGIYVYRADISSTNGETYSTGARKIAVTAK